MSDMPLKITSAFHFQFLHFCNKDWGIFCQFRVLCFIYEGEGGSSYARWCSQEFDHGWGGGAQQSLGLKNPLKSLVSLATPINYLNYQGWRTYRSVWQNGGWEIYPLSSPVQNDGAYSGNNFFLNCSNQGVRNRREI